MQAVLWALLGGSLGLAALVARHQRLAPTVDLRDARAIRLSDQTLVTLRLPRRWTVLHDAAEHDADDRGGPRVLIVAVEPVGGSDGRDAVDENGVPGAASGGGRRLTVRCERVAGPTSAATYLDHGPPLRGTWPAADDDDEPPADGRPAPPTGGPLPVAGTDGAWRAVRRPAGPGLPGGGAAPEYVAVGILPGGWALTIVLDCPDDDPDPAGSRDVLARVADAIVVVPAPGARPAGVR